MSVSWKLSGDLVMCHERSLHVFVANDVGLYIRTKKNFSFSRVDLTETMNAASEREILVSFRTAIFHVAEDIEQDR